MRLLMIADDFTGALDAGVQFAKKGFKTNVLVADGVCMSQYEDTEILVIDAETRHREAKEAGAIVSSWPKRLYGMAFHTYLKRRTLRFEATLVQNFLRCFRQERKKSSLLSRLFQG